MKQALIMTSYPISPVFQIEEVGFPVASPLDWVDCPDTATTNWHYDTATQQFIEPEVDPTPKPAEEL